MLFQALPDQRSGRMERFSFLLFISLGFFVLLLSPPVSDPVAVTPFCLCQCEWVLSFLPLHLCTLFLSLLCWLATVSLSEEVTGCPCGTRACIVLGQAVCVLPGSLVSVLSSPRHLDWIVIPHSLGHFLLNCGLWLTLTLLLWDPVWLVCTPAVLPSFPFVLKSVVLVVFEYGRKHYPFFRS